MISLFRHLRTKHKSQTSSPASSKPSCVHISLRTLEGSDQQDEPGHTTPSPATRSPEQAAAVPDSSEKCTACQNEKRARRKYRFKVIGGLLLPFALQALDSTIVASALPFIASHFGESSEMNWIVSSFNLSSAAFIPFWGQMADTFGRHATIQACLVILFVGSAICFASGTVSGAHEGSGFEVLLLGRGIQGLGCAGTAVVVRIILADKVSLKENAKNWSIFSATAGLSYGIGPVIGGYLSDDDNWKWCFGINLPICAAAILVIFFILRKELLGPREIPGQKSPDFDLGAEPRHRSERGGARSSMGRWATFSARLSTIDTGGQLLFLFGFGLIILALVWGGDSHGWDSVAVLVPLCIGVALVGIFIAFEWLMAPGNTLARRWPHRQPMLPWKLITNRDIGLLCFINFATGAAMYAVLYFCDIYFTGVLGHGPSKAGVQLLYYVPGLGVGVYLSMVLCNRWPRKTFVPIMLGSVIEALGIGMLTWALDSGHTPTIYGMMALTGAGTALRFMPSPLHAIGYFPDHISTIMSLLALMMTFGGTLGLTIMTTVYNNKWNPVPPQSKDIKKLWEQGSAEARAHEIPQIKNAIFWAFISILPIMIMCVVAAAMLGNVDITADQKREGEEGYDKHVTHEIYLLHLFKRWRKRSGVAARDDGLDDAENLKTISRGEGDDERAFFRARRGDL